MSLSLSVVCASIGNTQQLTVDARQLHHTLEVKRDFSSWIKGRIEKYFFKENEDFIVFTKTGENPLGGRASKEYRLSLDMAKELAMVENNERGRMVRRYFIECERRLREGPAKPKRKPKAVPAPKPALPPLPDVFTDGPISIDDVAEVLNMLAYRMEKTCHTMTEQEWKAGTEFFFHAAEAHSPDAVTHFRITNALSATLVGPLFTTRDLIRAAATMAGNAQKMHDIVCDCR